jgi:hypothetical protein
MRPSTESANPPQAPASIGDAMGMLRRLGREPASLRPVERLILADIESRCRSCSSSILCGRVLAASDGLMEPPAFCPNTRLFGYVVVPRASS